MLRAIFGKDFLEEDCCWENSYDISYEPRADVFRLKCNTFLLQLMLDSPLLSNLQIKRNSNIPKNSSRRFSNLERDLKKFFHKILYKRSTSAEVNCFVKSKFDIHNNDLNFIFLNPTSLNVNNIKVLKTVIQDSNTHIIGISETWFKDSKKDLGNPAAGAELQQTTTNKDFVNPAPSAELQQITTNEDAVKISGFQLIRDDRNIEKNGEKERGGGIALYIKENLPYRLIISNSDVKSYFQYMFVEVQIFNTNICVGVGYNNGKDGCSKFLGTLEDIVNGKKYDHIIFMGDLNLNFLNKNEKKVKEFNRRLVEMNLRVVNQIPTHFKQDKKPSLLDLIIIQADQDELIRRIHSSQCLIGGFSHALIYSSYFIKMNDSSH